MSRVVLYKGRKRQLIGLVTMLCKALRRPVSSADIREHLAEQSEAEIGYIQGLGQILLKASIPRPAPIPVLRQIGILRNRAYYAPNPDSMWYEAFRNFCAASRADYLIKRGYLTAFKIKPIHTSLERAAAFSLHQVIDQTVPYLDSPAVASRLKAWQDTHPVQRTATPCHQRIDRTTALEILQDEVSTRAPYIPSMNFNRHLARISPPVLRGAKSPYYSRELVRAYCAAQWPLTNSNIEEEAVSLLHWILVMLHLTK